MSNVTRRGFIKGTLATAATVTIAGTKSSGQVIGANNVIRIGVAGINGRGRSHMSEFSGTPNVQVTYLIDPDTRIHASRAATIRQRGGNTPRTVQDVRRALDDQNLDAISIATPNHWHALMTMWACQAGKDVYVEKPSSHYVSEGRQTVELARRHNRIVQHGTQSRSSASWARVMAVIHSGQLGRLLVSRGLCYKPRRSIGQRPNTPVPDGLDFNLWLGPAPQTAFHTNLVHYNWHWFWDFGNGDIGNQGVHQMDIARWAIRGATLPRSIMSIGGRFGYTDQGQTANTQISVSDYGQTKLIFEVRGLPTDRYRGQGIGNIFHLEEGTIAGSTFYPRNSDRPAPLPNVDLPAARPGGGNHFRNFIAAVRSRRQQDLNAGILEGHHSSALGHLGNISLRLGQNQPLSRASFGNDTEAAETFQRMQAHLRANNVQLDETQCRVGPRLTFNAENEQFTGNEAANRMLTRNNRRPFVVSENAASN